MNNLIEVVALDENDNEEFRRDFETQREARNWVKENGLRRDYWADRSESEDYPSTIRAIQLLVNGEIRDDWFPKF
jgi:hypothetical protein